MDWQAVNERIVDLETDNNFVTFHPGATTLDPEAAAALKAGPHGIQPQAGDAPAADRKAFGWGMHPEQDRAKMPQVIVVVASTQDAVEAYNKVLNRADYLALRQPSCFANNAGQAGIQQGDADTNSRVYKARDVYAFRCRPSPPLPRCVPSILMFLFFLSSFPSKVFRWLYCCIPHLFI